VDGSTADREGAFGWTVPSEELFRFHISQVRGLGGYLLGRRLLDLVETRTFGSRVIYERYRQTRDEPD
jgi:hypothetical protein